MTVVDQFFVALHDALAAAAVEPAVEPLEPVVDPLEPAVDPLEPVVEPLEPVVEPLEPVVGPLEPVVGPLEPVVGPSGVDGLCGLVGGFPAGYRRVWDDCAATVLERLGSEPAFRVGVEFGLHPAHVAVFAWLNGIPPVLIPVPVEVWAPLCDRFTAGARVPQVCREFRLQHAAVVEVLHAVGVHQHRKIRALSFRVDVLGVLVDVASGVPPQTVARNRGVSPETVVSVLIEHHVTGPRRDRVEVSPARALADRVVERITAGDPLAVLVDRFALTARQIRDIATDRGVSVSSRRPRPLLDPTVVAAEYRNGYTLAGLADRYGVPPAQIRAVLTTAGCVTRWRQDPPWWVADAVEAYRRHESTTVIGDRFGVNADTVRYWLRKHGVVLRRTRYGPWVAAMLDDYAAGVPRFVLLERYRGDGLTGSRLKTLVADAGVARPTPQVTVLRDRVVALHAEGMPVPQIAATVGLSPSDVAGVVRRHASPSS